MKDLAVSLVAIGLTLLVSGFVPALASFVITRSRLVVHVTGSTRMTEMSAATKRPYRGIVVPLHYPFTRLVFSFRETAGKDVDARIMDLVPEYGGGHVIMTYRDSKGSSGVLEIGLQPGTYDIHLSSTDYEDRNVEYTVDGREVTYPLRPYLEIALAIGTIGAVALVQGLVLFVD